MQRKSLPKRVIFQVHMWGGLSLGIYAFLIGVTGSVLVFREEIVHRIAPEPAVGASSGEISLERMVEAIRSQRPGWNIWAIEAPRRSDAPWSSYLIQPGGAGRE